MKIRDARALALEAVARGWMSTAELWELAQRWATLDGGGASPEVLFSGTSLDPVRVASLIANATNQPQTVPYPSDETESKKRDTEPRQRGATKAKRPRRRRTPRGRGTSSGSCSERAGWAW